MPVRDLPARPNLDHLKNEAKALHKTFRDGDELARQRVHDILGDAPDPFKLTDAQRALAREYGFPSWAKLRAHVQASWSVDEARDQFLAAVQQQNTGAARRILRAQPRIASESLHVAATLGLEAEARALIAADPARVRERVGTPGAEPLLYLCFSPFHGESDERDAGLLATARALLDAGADPNTVDGKYGVSALYGVTGMHHVIPIARLLLAAGANPNDGESVFHAAEAFHEEALELLMAAGVELNHTGEWGNTPLWFLLNWHDAEREEKVGKGVVWLLDHGADPNVLSGKERETALHVAARRGQSPRIIRLLLDHGADVNARRGDGSTPWLLASRGGFDEVAALLESVGAETRPASRLDQLLAACGRGDSEAARQLASPELVSSLSPEELLRLPEAAAAGRAESGMAYVAAGWPVNTMDSMGATALHHAAIHGSVALVRALLAAGADTEIRDNEHSSTPLGWACFGADFVADADGDYEGTVSALLERGAKVREDEHMAKHPGVRAAVRRSRQRSGRG